MVTKREFNRIKKENPESRIGKRTWEEQKIRNDLAKALIKARKKGIKTFFDEYSHENIELKRKNKDLEQKIGELKEEKAELREYYLYFEKEVDDLEKKVEKLEGINLRLNEKLGGMNLKLMECLPKIEGSNFEKIDLSVGIDETKLSELQQADLVLVYRDNNTYNDMSLALKNLVEHKYGGRVYCIVISQGIEGLSDNDKELLKNILKTCNVLTDRTISGWTGIIGNKIPEYEAENIQKFLGITKKLEESFIEKGIDTVYIYLSFIYKDWETGEPKLHYGLFDHGSMCQRNDGSTYYFDGTFVDHNQKEIFTEDEKLQIIEDAKRFWKKQFPNLNVEFIENHDQKSWEQYKPDDSVMIADRHSTTRLEPFLGQKIFFAGADFEPRAGIENFVNEEDYKYIGSEGEALAESVLLNIPSLKKTAEK